MRIETYDWLLKQAEDRAKPPQVSSSIFQHKDELAEMRAERSIESVFGDVQSASVWLSATRSFSYEYLLIDDWTDGRDVLYKDVRDYRLRGDNRLSRTDWDDWQDSPEMECEHRFTILATELEPDCRLQDSLTFISDGVWADEEGWWNSADFLLYLPLDLQRPDKEARCAAAKKRMRLLLIVEDIFRSRAQGLSRQEWLEAAHRVLPPAKPKLPTERDVAKDIEE
jgi:hypothetical protein